MTIEYGVEQIATKTRFGSCSSRAGTNGGTYDADVDRVGIKEDDHLNNNEDAIIKSDDDENAGNFGIANDYFSEDDDTLADEQKEKRTLSAVLTRRTEQNNAESAKGFLLAREAMVRFVQDFIAPARDR